MDALPYDLLRSIFLHVDPQDIYEKFRLAAVSRQWRDAALATALLWSTFVIASRKNAVVLPLLLARSAEAPLRVVVDFAGRLTGVPLTAAAQQQVIRRLLAHAARFQKLVLYLDSNTPPIAAESFLGSAVEFPALLHLEVIGMVPAPPLDIRARNLRVLELEHVYIVDGTTIFVASIEVLRLRYVADAGVLLDVFRACRNLRELELVSVGRSTRSDFTLASMSDCYPRHLRSITFRAPDADYDFALVLAAAKSTNIVSNFVDVSLSDGRLNSASRVDLMALMCHGLVAPLALDVRNADDSFELYDCNARTRRFRIWEPPYHTGWDWFSLGAHLPLAQLRRVSFDVEMWSALIPLAAQWPALDELCVRASLAALRTSSLPSATEDDHIAWSGNPIRMICGGLVSRIRIEMDVPPLDIDDWDGISIETVRPAFAQDYLRILARITLGRTDRVSPRVEVCMGDSDFMLRDNPASLLERVREMKLAFKESKQLQKPFRYVLCRHCDVEKQQ
ncbi:hypothetical protein EXIGLDRAFT_753504 [Exidia glandulosa HHB12029]|uniref:F-box domain-containing protein n=1 Tax=Exidia glandulosa HHB12029 TaxID=1314781 RepID=A0A165DPN0_EXIGL|nr:hypothetical protein EXIGLDRAFT_753504 [Exidia glandulosa HHB12029]